MKEIDKKYMASYTKLHYSQTLTVVLQHIFGFVPLQNYTTLKHHFSDFFLFFCFVPIQNYTTLKLYVLSAFLHLRFVPIQNYTTLKRMMARPTSTPALYPYKITLLSNLKYLRKRPTNRCRIWHGVLVLLCL